jgi:hypothetical protein
MRCRLEGSSSRQHASSRELTLAAREGGEPSSVVGPCRSSLARSPSTYPHPSSPFLLPSQLAFRKMDIPNDKSQQSAAPTPMNSLANGGLVNPGTSVAPRVATLGEEDESGANPASMLSRVSRRFLASDQPAAIGPREATRGCAAARARSRTPAPGSGQSRVARSPSRGAARAWFLSPNSRGPPSGTSLSPTRVANPIGGRSPKGGIKGTESLHPILSFLCTPARLPLTRWPSISAL